MATAQDLMKQLEAEAASRKTFADRLRDERNAYQQAATQFIERTTPEDLFTQNGVPLAPSQVSASRKSLLQQVGETAGQYSPELELRARESGTDILANMLGIMAESEGASTYGMDLTSQINNLSTGAERNAARFTKDTLDAIDNAINKFSEGAGTETGPLSAIEAQWSKLSTPNQTAQLEKDLNEIMATIRKDRTGVAFSPEEIKELKKEIPTILQQEGNVSDSLLRLRQRMLQKLSNYGINTDAEYAATTSLRDADEYAPSFDEDKLLNDLGI